MIGWFLLLGKLKEEEKVKLADDNIYNDIGEYQPSYVKVQEHERSGRDRDRERGKDRDRESRRDRDRDYK